MQLKRVFLASLTAASVAGLALGTAAPAFAQDANSGIRVRAWAGAVGRYVLKDNESFESEPFGTVSLTMNNSTWGVGADAEYKFSRWIGVDAAAGYTNITVDFMSSLAPSTVSQAKFKVVPLLFSLNVHVISTKAVDVWAGPEIGYFTFPDDLSFPVQDAGTFAYMPSRSFSKKGFTVGADIGLHDHVCLNLQFRWQNGDGDPDGHLTIDPTFVVAGVTIR